MTVLSSSPTYNEVEGAAPVVFVVALEGAGEAAPAAEESAPLAGAAAWASVEALPLVSAVLLVASAAGAD